MQLLLSTGGWIGIGVAVAVVVIIIIWAIAAHNKFVSLSEQCEEGFSTIDIYLKKRFDLIPNLVNTVKGYAKHESETLQQVIEARNMAGTATTAEDKIKADNAMSKAVRSFNVVVERYPELKANTNFLQLQSELNQIETELSQARKYYNATVRTFNSAIRSFPSSIIAGAMKLKRRSMFELDDVSERQNVKVEF